MTKVKLGPRYLILYRRVGASEWHLQELGETMSDGNAEYALYTRSDIASTEIARLRAEIERMRSLLSDAIEDETEFETEWNKAARAALKESDQ